MKKIILIIVLAINSITFSQVDKATENVTNRMATAMELTDEQKAEVFKLVAQRDADRKALKEKFGDDVDGFKIAVKDIEVDFNKKLRAYVGNPKMKKWADFNLAQKGQLKEKENNQNNLDEGLVNISNKMQEIMELTDEEKGKAYELLIERKNGRISLKKEYGNDEEGFKASVKNVEIKFNQDLSALVGKERRKKWNAYNKEKNNN